MPLISFIKITELSKYTKGIINRVHICMAMMEHGYISSVQEGFKDYVGDHCKAFVERKTVTIEEAIEAVHKDGGIAILAHPYEYVDDIGPVDDILNNVLNLVDGIECFHPSATLEQSQHLAQIANNNHKLITGGSDFHGNNKPDIALGMMNVNDEYIIR